ncbi:hypothetical protein GCM10010339_89400 [Streptomyces alanosinicus]|uniref:Uncharacterized protein n=1 Tax=Streptomyces alanosinicus TaxID=68171 RepID=A0A919D8I0_9ACTN|nr:hypothetical protein GCM10010339_89400 [Streptomyces alanosinicus]
MDGSVEAAEYRVWVRAPEHVRPVTGVDYDQVPTERMEKPSAVREILGPRRPSGWVLQKLRAGRGPAGAILHTPDCQDAPQDAPLLDLERALNVAENPATRPRCTAPRTRSLSTLSLPAPVSAASAASPAPWSVLHGRPSF